MDGTKKLTERNDLDQAPQLQDWVCAALRRYERPLMRYAARLLGDPERGRDIVQDTFLRLCRQKQARVQGHLAEWLYTVCRNRALDVLRKEKRMSSLNLVRMDFQASPQPGPDRKLEAKEGLTRLQEILETFPANQQEVVRLKFQSGLTYREISHVTKLSESNVGFLLHTALKKIRATFSNEPAQRRESLRRVK